MLQSTSSWDPTLRAGRLLSAGPPRFFAPLQVWTHSSAELPEDAVDRDTLLTNVMLYWLTGTAGSAARMYYENGHSGDWFPVTRSEVPTAVANFGEDVAIRRWTEETNTVVRWTEFDRGGHFAALEVPELLTGDIREFFGSLR